ncbi:MAG: 50S ribosomal protein L3 [Fibrobacteres bacterium]|nr:50S ribosomal protein L3 [Fibrobacterota bacterium]
MINKIFAKKVGMTSWFDASGRRVPVTVVEVMQGKVVQIKNVSNDGYNAIVVGFSPVEERKVNKPRLSLFKKVGIAPVRELREIKVDDVKSFTLGQDIGIEAFGESKLVKVIGTSKGLGFTGVIKKHNFQRGRETHGNKMHREGGSIGNHTDPAKVWKGKKMAGHHGDAKITVKNIEVVKVFPEKRLILLKGAVPGANNRIVDILKA